MMKNKTLTYVLGVAVAIIWGLIIYRVVTGLRANDDSDVNIAVNTVKEPYNDYSIPKDTTRLLLNYRDPFGLVKPKDTIKVIPVVSHKATIIPKPSINWSFIKYSGYIRNPKSKKLIAILTINGRNVLLAEGEADDNVKLLKNLRDSIRISFNGKIKYISMHSGQL
jgi:hypothetical protein